MNWAPSYELFVGDDDGTLKILRVDADSYKLINTLKLTSSSSGQMRFDPATQRLYVANYPRHGAASGSDYGLLGIIDVRTGRYVGDIRVRGQMLKAFAMEAKGPRIFVLINERDKVAVVNRKTRPANDRMASSRSGFPLHHCTGRTLPPLFVVTREPGKLIVLNSETGNQITSLPAPAGVDDVYYDGAHGRIYLSAGVGSSSQGWIAVYRQLDADHYRAVETVPTGSASATSRLVPQLNQYYVVAQGNGDQTAEVQVYETEP